jgi:hypothetical protein
MDKTEVFSQLLKSRRNNCSAALRCNIFDVIPQKSTLLKETISGSDFFGFFNRFSK